MLDRYVYIALSPLDSVSASLMESIVSICGGTGNLLSFSPKDLSSVAEIDISLAEKIVGRLHDFKENPYELEENASKMGFGIVTYCDPLYPGLLKSIPDAPPVLYYKGSLDSGLQGAIAIVGARKAQSYGIEMSFNIARQLAVRGLSVVSGMAKGIDAAAHKGCLVGGEKTFAVLGSGIDVIYPREHAKLFSEISENGAVITEFPMGAQPLPYRFPRRNRIIAGLSIATVVIQADIKSGSLITANKALEYGRDVMAVPGPVFSNLSRGPHALIKDGAPLVESADDILAAINLNFISGDLLAGKHRAAGNLKETEEEVLSMVDGFLTAAEIAEQIQLPSHILFQTLSVLEFKGYIKTSSGGVYVRRESGNNY